MNIKAILMHDDAEFINKLDDTLWTFKQLAFIPHVKSDHKNAAETPIVLQTPPFNNINQAEMVIILGQHTVVPCNKLVQVFDHDDDYVKAKTQCPEALCWIQDGDIWKKEVKHHG